MKKISLFLFVTLITGSLFAQTTVANKKSTTYFGVNFDLGFPFGSFQTVNDEIAIGGGVNLFFQPDKQIPILLGYDIPFLGNGHKSQTETLTATIEANGTIIQTLSFPLRAETSNIITKGHLNVRFLAPTKTFQPYVDGLIGFNHFGTSTAIYDESPEHYFTEEDDDLITSSSQNSSWAVSYGGAAGLMVEIKENVFLDLRFMYTMGSKAEYYVEDDIEQWEISYNSSILSEEEIDEDDISIAAIPKESRTDMMVGTLGLSFKF